MKIKSQMKTTEKSGERYSYHVASASQPEMGHSVNMTANGGLGACTCPDCEFRALKNQEAGEYVEWRPGEKGATECKHMAAARRQFWIDKVIPLMAAFELGQPEDIGGVIREFFAWEGIK